MLRKIPILSNPKGSKQLSGITAKTVISIKHTCRLGFAKPPGMTQGNALILRSQYPVGMAYQFRLVYINKASNCLLKASVIRIKICPHHTHLQPVAISRKTVHQNHL